MKYYVSLAKDYFQKLEGWKLYPSYKHPLFWAWMVITFCWFFTLFKAITAQATLHSLNTLYIVIAEAIWLTVTKEMTNFKEKKLIQQTNEIYGTKFTKVYQCRYHILINLIQTPSEKFLEVAKEIDGLISLHKNFRKKSDIHFTELLTSIYDRDSKARLITLILALVSMTVILAAKSDATLDTLFEAFSEKEYRDFVWVLMFMTVVMFFVYMGLRILWLTIADGLALWIMKLSGGANTNWLLGYLIRDLVAYHKESASALENQALKVN